MKWEVRVSKPRHVRKKGMGSGVLLPHINIFVASPLGMKTKNVNSTHTYMESQNM
jgi:hypothetical protein